MADDSHIQVQETDEISDKRHQAHYYVNFCPEINSSQSFRQTVNEFASVVHNTDTASTASSFNLPLQLPPASSQRAPGLSQMFACGFPFIN